MVNVVLSFLGACVMAIFGWAFNLQSRMSKHEAELENLKTTNGQRYETLKELIVEKIDSVKAINQAVLDTVDVKFDAQALRLDRIERSMNGHLQK